MSQADRAQILGKPRQFKVKLPAGRGVGRTLVCKTCVACGELKMAADFPVTGSQRNPDPRCRACHAHRRRGSTVEMPPKPWGRTVLAASCRSCCRFLAPSAFPKTSGEWECRDCHAERTRHWAASNPERVAANRAATNSRWNEIADAAKRRGYDWTGPEIEVAMRQDLTIAEAAKMLGRTVHGVRWVRRQVTVDPRKQAFL